MCFGCCSVTEPLGVESEREIQFKEKMKINDQEQMMRAFRNKKDPAETPASSQDNALQI